MNLSSKKQLHKRTLKNNLVLKKRKKIKIGDAKMEVK